MIGNNIEIQIIHTRAMEKDNGFAVRLVRDGEDISPLELEKEELLHIGAILLNASRKFLNHATGK